MAKTFNRQPYTINTPSGNDIKTYNFLHSNWKGISLEKNFIKVDQETFADTKNVYVDSEGLLRSRPSIKVTHIKGNDGNLRNIINMWNFENITIYMTESEGNYKLHIFNNENLCEVPTDKEVKLILVEQKIFVFSETSLHYYDINDNVYLDATDYIYIPVKKLYMNNSFTDFESENEFTSSYRNRYLFENIDDINFTKIVGKTVTIIVDDKEYIINFVNNNQLLFVEKKMSLSENNYISIPSIYGQSYPLVSVSENNIVLVATSHNDTLTEDNTYDIYYTTDFVTFTRFPTINNVVGLPKISKDGYYAYCMKEDDIYVISIADRNQDYYTDWTPLLQTKYSDWYNSFDDKPWYDNSVPTVEMDSLDIFAIHCTPVIGESDSTSYESTRGLILCNEGDIKSIYTNIKTKAIKSNSPGLDFSDYKQSIILGDNVIGEIHYLQYFTDFQRVDKSQNVIYKITQFCTIQIENVKINLSYKGNDNVYTIEGKVSIAKNGGLFDNVDGLYDVINEYEFSRKIVNSGDFMIENVKISINNEGKFVSSVMDFYTDLLNSTDYFCDNLVFDNIPNIKLYKYNTSLNILLDTGILQNINFDNQVVKTYNFVPKAARETLSNCSPLLNDFVISNNVVKYACCLYDTSIKTYVYHLFKCVTKLNDFGVLVDDVTVSNYIRSSNIKGAKFNENRDLCVSGYLYLNDVNDNNTVEIKMLFDAVPVQWHNVLYLYDDNTLYSNSWSKSIIIDEIVKGNINIVKPEYFTELSNFYFSKNKTLYISKYPSDGKFKWYFPKLNTEQFDYKITNLHPISPTEVAVFTNDNVYYVQTTENGYMYYKSKIQVGCADGADVITTYDGVYTIFPSKRGLVAMTYQQFVATTEQSLSYLTDNIYEMYNKFNNKPIKLFKYLFWIVCYKENETDVLLFDIRNNSWWFNTSDCKLVNFLEKDNNVLILINNYVCSPNTSYKDYHDETLDNSYRIGVSKIHWYVKSQKLHFNSIEHQKNIIDITLTSLDDATRTSNFNLQLINYRKTATNSKEQNLKYKIDIIRTFVKHLNCMKVNQIQYILSSNDEDFYAEPFNLSSLNIKYKITRQVR